MLSRKRLNEALARAERRLAHLTNRMYEAEKAVERLRSMQTREDVRCWSRRVAEAFGAERGA